MTRIWIVGATVVVGMTGCQSFGWRNNVCNDVCATDVCSTPTRSVSESHGSRNGGGHGGRTSRAPRVEVEDIEPIVVKAPPQKIIVETPARESSCHHGARDGGCQQAAPAAAPMTPMAMAPAMAMAPSPMITATSSSHTRLGFALDTIRIPIPWLRPVAVQGPQEVRMQIPMQQPAPMMMAPQMMAPMMAAPQVMATGAYAAPMMAAGQPMMPAAPQPQGQLVCPPCPPCPPNNGISPERVQQFTKRIEELEKQLQAQEKK